MQKNLYLEELGIEQKKYGTNFLSNHDKRNKEWKEERKNYGFDNRETWNMDHIFVEWLYSHLVMFCDVNIIDTTFHKFEWNGKTITLQDAIDLLINAAKEYLVLASNDEADDYEIMEKFSKFCELMPLWGIILPYMNW